MESPRSWNAGFRLSWEKGKGRGGRGRRPSDPFGKKPPSGFGSMKKREPLPEFPLMKLMAGGIRFRTWRRLLLPAAAAAFFLPAVAAAATFLVVVTAASALVDDGRVVDEGSAEIGADHVISTP